MGLGRSDTQDEKDAEDEVNDYLMHAIDARSIDSLRSEHCKPILLTFRKADVETKVIKQTLLGSLPMQWCLLQ